MDGWQAAQNWAVFAAVAAGLGWYYYPRKQFNRALPPVNEPKEQKVSREPRDTKKEVKRPNRKQDVERSAGSSAVVEDESKRGPTGNKKRKAVTQTTVQGAVASATEQADDQEEIDMSTRQFAANMQKAREGIQVKSPNNNDSRVKTVKPKDSLADQPNLPSGSSQVNTDDKWSPVASPTLNAGGVDDMLEPTAPGPSALRIMVSEKPTKEKVNKQSKKDVAETKKQRQNRKKAEEAKLVRDVMDKERAVQAENQRRTAREARGEPAKNGITVARVPVKNAWTEKGAARDSELPAVDSTNSTMQLLDTLDTESNSSSNQEASTAATSVVADAAPSRWAEENDLAKAVEESVRDSGWNEVKSSKKSKKKKNSSGESDGDTTPVVAPILTAKATLPAAKHGNNLKPIGFQALNDEGEHGEEVDSSDPMNWAA